MEFKRKTEQALDEWVGAYATDTKHGEDTQRFYLFVNQYLQDHGYRINEKAMKDAIKRRFRRKGHLLGTQQERLVSDRVALANRILAF